MNWLKKPVVLWGGLLSGVIGTAVFLVVFTKVVAMTNTMDFCVSCHSMTYPYEEYKKSFHYQNTVGVQAGCPDCHVPKTYPEKLVAKVLAYKDVLHEILGTIDTKEKFEEYRLTMAKRVWHKMEATKSQACRNCHNFDNMLFDEQGRRAGRKHQEAQKDGDHCISCHKGVVHEMPKDYEY
ncbi:MAG: NapC/NirT family cytochrome c [Alphaproteobacteria bacterium]|nr:NapC/NirT family cytochrome c [Alphaproteobacteria bacterium]